MPQVDIAGGAAQGRVKWATKAVPTGAYAVSLDDDLLVCTTGSSTDCVPTLPTPADAIGERFEFKKIDAGSKGVVITSPVASKIDGATTLTLTTQYNYAVLVSDGTNYNVQAVKIG